MYVQSPLKEELNALSKEVFGSSSRWQKLVDKGHEELVMEEIAEYVPSEKEGEQGTERKVKVPVKTSFGALQYVIKRYTVDSIKEYMIERKIQMEELSKEIARRQEEYRVQKEQEKLANKVHEELHGSAL